MKIDLSKIDSLSAFELESDKIAHIELALNQSTYESPVRLVTLRDVLYLPSAVETGQSLSFKNTKTIPKESYIDDYVFSLVQDWVRNRHINERYLSSFATNHVSTPVCILGNIFSRNFGHWTEELLKVAILEKYHIDCCYVVADLPKFATDFLVFLGVSADRILSITDPTIFSRAVFTTGINHENIARYPSVLMEFRKLVQTRRNRTATQHSPRLWLERSSLVHHGGLTLNKDDVYNLLAKYEFQIVDMATLSIEDQMAAAANATIIAGSHGAQFVHAQFMPTSSVVIECFSPMLVNPSILQICRVLRHTYHQVVSRSHWLWPYCYGRDCKVDVEHLELILDNLRTETAKSHLAL